MIKTIQNKPGKHRGNYETVETLLEAIELAWGCEGAHIHQGDGVYYVCYCETAVE